MAREKLESGHRGFEFRPGLNKFPSRFRGIQRQLDPGAIRPDQFWTLQNARLSEGEVVSRGGQSKVFPSPMDGTIFGVFDDGNGTLSVDFAPKLYVSTAGFCTYHPDQDPTIQDTSGNGLLLGRPIGVYNSRILYEFQSGADTIFKSILATSGEGTPTPTTEFTATGIQGFLGKGLEVGGVFYFFCETPSLRVYSYDGASVSLEDTSASNVASLANQAIVAVGNDVFYAGINTILAGDSWIVRRKSAGVWSDYAVDASPSIQFTPGLLTGYDSSLYAAVNGGLDAYIYEVTAGAFTVVRTLASSTLESLCSFNGYLYYLYKTGGAYKLGRFNGSVWDDTHCNAPLPVGAGVKGLVVVDDCLAILETTTDVPVYASDGTDTTSFALEGTATGASLTISTMPLLAV